MLKRAQANGLARISTPIGMKVLLMLPKLRSLQEPWAERMFEALGERVVGIAAGNAGGETQRNGLPVLDVLRTSAGEKIQEKLLRRRQSGVQHRLEAFATYHEVTHVVCHFATLAEQFLDLWPKLNARTVVVVHGPDAVFDLRSFERPEIRVHPIDYRERVVRLSEATTLVAHSHSTKALLVAGGVPDGRVVVNPIGVRVAKAPMRPQKKDRLRVVSVGRLIDFKSPTRTIGAFEKACEMGLDAELFLAGSGPMEREVRKRIEKSPLSDRIKLMGLLNWDQLLGLLYSSDIYTQHNVVGERTGEVEDLGLAYIEAMSIGLPCVGTASGGVPEVVESGHTGLMVEPGNIEAHAQALLHLGQDPALRQSMGLAGWKRVGEHFTVQREVANLLRVLEGQSEIPFEAPSTTLAAGS